MNSKWLVVVVVLLWVALPPSMAAQSSGVSGVVAEQQSRRPIPNLEVRLIPPRAAGQAVRVTHTDAQGRFGFPGAARGAYLLEVSSGMNLLYRAEINTARQTGPILIQLQRR